MNRIQEVFRNKKAFIPVHNSDTLGLGDLINTDKALSVIMAIFVSVAIAFFFGMEIRKKFG